MKEKWNFGQAKILKSGLILKTLTHENIVEKGENAGDQHFFLFPTMFLLFQQQISIFQSHLFCRLQMLSIWTSLQFCHLVKS